MRHVCRTFLGVLLAALMASGQGTLAGERDDRTTDRQAFHIYWGDLHGHSSISDGTQNNETPKRQTPDDYYRYGRDVMKLDFLALTDHAEYISEDEWKELQQVASRFDAPGRFVTLLGYEWSDETKGHRVVLFPDLRGGPVYAAPSARKHFGEAWLQRPKESFVDQDQFFQRVCDSGGIVHAAHPSLGDCQADWKFHDPQVELNVEMAGTTGNPEGLAECWYEASTTPRQHPNQQGVTGCWVQDALTRGYRLGFLGVNDTHSCEPGLKAKTAVLAKDLSREAIFDAIRQRRVYAVSRDRVDLRFEINGHVMGEEFKTNEPLKIELSASGEQYIVSLEVLKNNQVVWRKKLNGISGTLTADDQPTETAGWYYGRVVFATGHRAWTSPIWVSNQR